MSRITLRLNVDPKTGEPVKMPIRSQSTMGKVKETIRIPIDHDKERD